jgi:hypothetical protein
MGRRAPPRGGGCCARVAFRLIFKFCQDPGLSVNIEIRVLRLRVTNVAGTGTIAVDPELR